MNTNSMGYASCAVASWCTLLLVFTANPAIAAATPEGSIKGIVTNGMTGERLRKSYVRLAPASEQNKVRPAVTDEQGRFLFENVAPGNYSLEAEHPGFVDGKYGGELKIAAGQDLPELNIRLSPSATIAGRVTDEDGDPWTHAGVGVFSVVWESGARQLVGLDSAEVDERGEFRIARLPPGRYYLCARPDAEWERTNRRDSTPRLQPTWYPSSLDSGAAAALVLLAGQELTGLEIRLRRSSVYRIRGKVSGLEEIPALPGPTPWMKPRLTVSRVTANDGNAPWANMQPDGSFEVQGVAPGAYKVTVSQGVLPRLDLGSAVVAVSDHDVDNLQLTVFAPHPLKGSIRIDEESGGLPAGLNLWLYSPGLGSDLTAMARPDGTFEFPQVTAGRFRLGVGGAFSSRYFVQSVRYGGVESTGAAFSVSSGPDSLEVILGSRGGRVSGTVKRSDDAETSAPQIVLLPDTSDSELRAFDMQAGLVDQTGAFTFRNAVRPGAYFLCAFEDVPQGAWTDAEFLKQIDGKIRIDVAEDKAIAVEVPLIRRSDIAALLNRLGMN